MGKKQDVLLELFRECQKRGDFGFDNDMVEAICRRVGFKNKFDVTKLDNINLLPPELRKQNYAIIHKGRGKHQFVQGIEQIYHRFEPVESETTWPYRKSLLNEYNSSEANVLSIANNQRILHHFLFGLDVEFETLDISERPKTYFPHRTKADLRYRVGEQEVQLDRVQIEIDLTIEYQGIIGVFEAKNGRPETFSIYQLYHPFLYYYKAKTEFGLGEKIREIIGVYVVRRKEQGISVLSLWAYSFDEPLDMTSIRLLRSRTYRLERKND
ncbi:MAG: hypothetical protein N2117_00585 [Anaerolineales bacterium]|nr:hypothetical protein [Anaerolineales bacterium]MCX7753726.1 hypothetical protein [Anaerolineales bacterium]MDW8276494.1 hypothetical protein [Anaerolineales bacterium]